MKKPTQFQRATKRAKLYWPDRYDFPFNDKERVATVRNAWVAGYFAGMKSAQDKTRRKAGTP